MKKVVCLFLTMLLVLSLACLPAQAAQNHVKTAWEAKVLKGLITESTEDGVKVYTYTPNEKKSWYSPTLDVTAAVKEIIGDRDGANVLFAFEVRAVFEEGYENGTVNAAGLIRGMDGTKATGKDNVDAWAALYNEGLDGEEPFFINENGNIMGRLMNFTFSDEEWTLFEPTERWIARGGNLDSSLAKNWLMCMDCLDWEETGLKAIQVRNAAVYDADEYAAEHAPAPTDTPAPVVTDAPTEAPTDAPTETPTDVPAFTMTDMPTDAPTATGTAEPVGSESDFNALPIVICAVCVLAVAAVVVVAVVTGGKKKS